MTSPNILRIFSSLLLIVLTAFTLSNCKSNTKVIVKAIVIDIQKNIPQTSTQTTKIITNEITQATPTAHFNKSTELSSPLPNPLQSLVNLTNTKTVGVTIGIAIDENLSNANYQALASIQNQLSKKKYSPEKYLRKYRTEKLDKQYFVAYKYDTRSLIKQVEELLEEGKVSEDESKELFYQLPLSKKLIRKGKLPNYELVYSDEQWQVTVKDELLPIKENVWYKNFFVRPSTRSIKIHIDPKNHLQEGEKYFVDVNTSKNGFLSLFLITELGQVTLLNQVNQATTPNRVMIFPNLKNKEAFIAHNNSEKPMIRNFILAVVCPTTNEGFLYYQDLANQPLELNDERLYNYGRLLQDSKGCYWGNVFLAISK